MENKELVVSQYNPLDFFLFGMDRVGMMPEWQLMDLSMPVLHLGPGKKGNQIGTVDCEWPDYDFDAPNSLRFPTNGRSGYDDNSVGGVVATHVLEHLKDPRTLIWEVARVLAPGRPFNIVVPKAGSNIFWQDLDHKTGFVLDTWKTLLDNSYYTKGKSEETLLSVGFNMEMSMREGNNVIVTQLIKN
jgi:SAM-dependent methyltransferase